MTTGEQVYYDEQWIALREQMDSREFDSASSKGRALEQAIELALENDFGR